MGPLDEPDEEVNGDPDATLGDDDEDGYDEMSDWPETLFVEDDGFDDAEEGDDEDDDCFNEDDDPDC